MEKQKVAIYCRLSTEDEGVGLSQQESESIQNQRLLLTDFAKKQGWVLYHIYCDEDYSGLDDNRPQFCNMISDAKAGKFSIILCKTQSRFTRNMETAERYLHHYFLLWNIRFVTVVDHVDTDLKGNKKARQINGLINEWYCEEISDNIRAVFRRKMELGQFVGNYAPYGYLKNPKNHHQLEIDKEAAKIVRHIFTLYLEKYLSCKKIAETLTEAGVETPWQRKLARGQDTGRKNVSHPQRWSETTVRKILRNQVYVGDMVQGRERKLSFKEKKVIHLPENQWIVAKNTHEPIISRNTFEKTKKEMEKRRKQKQKS